MKITRHKLVNDEWILDVEHEVVQWDCESARVPVPAPRCRSKGSINPSPIDSAHGMGANKGNPYCQYNGERGVPRPFFAPTKLFKSS